ncbi:hypothetical protein [Saccharopolyspora phatthalungensis]|uniref:Uncharacterized protein n=1 Tax=Saccharopolyspora phatthalungensis TaxID=664693 RepID=A0A840QFI1_9PSEU|nr:hypothetical protein [Saccharopolyspora phatthalungensis]MBB5155853.1 hypothetical protein [Saccharopolyspora phatthalungensis]
MNVRIDPDFLARLARELDNSTNRLGDSPPSPEADAGPSSGAVSATLADLLQAAAGMAETVSRAAADLDANKATYAGTDEVNEGMFRSLGS